MRKRKSTEEESKDEAKQSLLSSGSKAEDESNELSPEVKREKNSEKQVSDKEENYHETKKRKKRFGALLGDKHGHSPEDDPEYLCCYNFRIHFVVFIMACIFGAIAFCGFVERFCTYLSDPDDSRKTVELLFIVLVVSLANGCLILGNRFRFKQLYHMYFLLLMGSVIGILVFMDQYLKVTIDALIQDPRYLQTEKELWEAFYWALPRLFKAFFTSLVLILHVMITFYVYRDYCFVVAYPNEYKHNY
ncbi:unnamed protein product [Bursaphelenchus okinawaensis]|uniref:Uncharacterized protein n=1 Tax=Bursaphelenchus okinawaensis TaxID=465554 RepID=A0A811LF00_9BILA|nr:unnamed protein product [Bursaphelenchus okinawaensis]CAG9124046.1 unnamed protein product [Bursaphelenchus okinawaensis]